jgi:hypothetical protein
MVNCLCLEAKTVYTAPQVQIPTNISLVNLPSKVHSVSMFVILKTSWTVPCAKFVYIELQSQEYNIWGFRSLNCYTKQHGYWLLMFKENVPTTSQHLRSPKRMVFFIRQTNMDWKHSPKYCVSVHKELLQLDTLHYIHYQTCVRNVYITLNIN